MLINAQVAAINFPAYDAGTLSPYPTLRKENDHLNFALLSDRYVFRICLVAFSSSTSR